MTVFSVARSFVAGSILLARESVAEFSFTDQQERLSCTSSDTRNISESGRFQTHKKSVRLIESRLSSPRGTEIRLMFFLKIALLVLNPLEDFQITSIGEYEKHNSAKKFRI